MTSNRSNPESPGTSIHSGEQSLRPRARFLRTFGDELISSEKVALIELVKNSYDADASRVLVRFTPPLTAGGGAIEVIDDGHGMSLETVQTAWMEPATLVKRKRTHSEGLGRRVLGEKGIGRFAASRLAQRLDVITKRRDSSSQTKILFDWKQFDDPDLFLDEVKVSWLEEPPTEFTRLGTIRALWGPGGEPTAAELSHGTILRMQNLSSKWTEDEVDSLRLGLSRLVSPFSAQLKEEKTSPAGQFRIDLEVPEPLSHLSGAIEPPGAVQSAHYIMRGSVDECGGYEVEIKLKGREKYERVSKAKSKDAMPRACGPFGIQLRVWDRDAASLGDIAKAQDSTVRTVRGDLDAVAGINVYRDGFRVLPYGERDDDWLRLDLRRVQNPTLRLSNNQIVGYVLIDSDQNPDLKDQSNREGLIEGPALDTLRDGVKEMLTLIETRRRAVRADGKRPQSRRGGLFQDFDLANLQDYVKDNYPNDAALARLVALKASDLDHRVEEAQESLARYHSLATLGSLVDRVLHDGRATLSKISQTAFMSQRDVTTRHDIPSDLVTRLKDRISTIRDQTEVMATLFRRIEPFGGRRRARPRKFKLEGVIRDAFEVLSSDRLRLGVKVELPTTSTTLSGVPAEIQEVIVNLLMNSFHWLEQIDKDRRRVKVEVLRKSTNVQIVFSDSGPGVEDEFVNHIFDPYFSTKPDGVGLGLSIAGDIVNDYYNGDIELLREGPLPGATFRITLRKRL